MAPATWERDQVFAARRLLSEALRERIVGDGLISRLSTIGAQWLANRRHTVITLIGPTGTGKTAVARALSEALKRVALGMGAGSRPVIPSVVVDLQELSEGSAWWGRSLADEVLALYQEAGSDLTLAEAGAVIVLDGMDSMAFRRRTGSGREFTRSKQTSVLPVLSGANVPFSSQGSEHARDSFSCAHSLVIMTARLDSLEPEPPPAKPPAPIDIQRQGYSPELVSRLGTLMVMPALTDGEQRELLAQLLARESDAWKDWGYLLKVSKQAVGLVSSLLQGQRLGLAIPSAAALLQTAAREKLEELVAEDAAEGTEWLLTPDAVRLPDVKTKPGWRG
jgi:SpoVK/Ycf46/Vps4 family AAA+-type ATPase